MTIACNMPIEGPVAMEILQEGPFLQGYEGNVINYKIQLIKQDIKANYLEILQPSFYYDAFNLPSKRTRMINGAFISKGRGKVPPFAFEE